MEKGGYDVKLSEVHGMAQRGGSVVTYVRYGDKVEEPIVEEGQTLGSGTTGFKSSFFLSLLEHIGQVISSVGT